jgi:hypothetical protein
VSRYRAGYSEKHSPFYDAGLADGLADATRESDEDKQGMDPDKAWSAMYRRGYDAGLGGGEAA